MPDVSTTFSPVAEPDERALASESLMREALTREAVVAELDRLPVPRTADFWLRVALHATEMSNAMSAREAVTAAARREVKIEFRLHPARAAFHRRANTRRWRFARDGAL